MTRPAERCTYCGEETSSWPSTSCEEPLQHDRATYVCDCGEELTVQQAVDQGTRHARCHLIG